MLQPHRLPVLVAVSSAFQLLLALPAPAQIEELAAKVPSSANAIALLDAQKLLASPLAAREGWKEKYEQSFASGLVSIPPDTQRMIVAAQFDYEYMKPVWEAALADMGRPRALAEVARATKGTLDPIGETPAIALRDDAYLIQFGPSRLAAMSPANRQSVARWLREAQTRTSAALSPYLTASLVAAQESPIVLAFDLENAVPPDIIRAKLASSSALAGKNINLDAAAKALAGVRGLALEVAVTDGTYGRLRVHFSSDTSVLTPVAKPLLLEVLGDLGASIDDIANWQVEHEPQRITFHGSLSAAGRRRVFSLIDHPTSSIIAADREASTSQSSVQAKAAAASQQYFKSVVSILDDVRDKSKNAKTFGENALWFDKWARRIDRLPVLNVDQDLLAFGINVANQLRDMAAALRGIGIQSSARAAQVTGGAGSERYYGGYSSASAQNSYYADLREVSSERRAIRSEERAKGAINARNIAQGLESETAKIRQAMSQKYQVEF